MSEERGREVQVTFAEGVREDIAGLVASSTADDKISEFEVEALKRRIGETALAPSNVTVPCHSRAR
jgi:hypothetical protein